MNNYRDYYNYQNNNYNLPNYKNSINNDLYDPYDGFIKGNMFPDLYNDYKMKPIAIKPNNEQAELLTYIDALCFALTDLNLFLDINPENEYALNLFNEYRNQKNAYLNEYQSKFGPIDLDSAYFDREFTWIRSPWPWEGDK